jgi:hypothetical protein
VEKLVCALALRRIRDTRALLLTPTFSPPEQTTPLSGEREQAESVALLCINLMATDL